MQDDLFAVGAALADPDPTGKFHGAIQKNRAERLEAAIDAMDAELPALTHFILPGGSPAAAHVHLARTVCRRAERLVVNLSHHEIVPAELIVYLNRLSDYLFVLARDANHQAGVADIIWDGL